MSVAIDKRVVEMQFDNKQFERNVQASLGTLDKLKMALDFDGAKGLESITKAANKMDLSNITRQTDTLKIQFSALQVAGMTVIQELTKSFLNFGKGLWNMSLGQMKSGGMARTLKIEQAEFKLKALAKNILKVEEESAELTAYVEKMSKAASAAVDGTAYGYDSAMSVVSQLVASGVNDAETMESYLKGIAGSAAMTGRSFDDIGRIFATVASNGKLMTMQLRQFSAAGFNVAAVLADKMSVTEETINDMVQKGQISFEMFAEKISEAYGDSAQKADETFAGVTSNIRAQLSKVGQLFTDPYVKHMIPFLQKVKAAIKELRVALEPTAERFDRIFKRLTQYATVIVEEMDFTRLDTIVRGIENILFGLAGIIYTIHEAFRDTFDKKTVTQLQEMAWNFERLTEALLPSAETLAGIRTAFKFLFSILKVGVKIVGSLQKAFKPLLVSVFRILGSVIGLLRHLEPLANTIIKFLKESSLLEISMEIIANIIEVICNSLVILISLLDSIFGDIVTIETFKRLGNVLRDISNIISSVIIVSLLVVYAVIQKIMSLVQPDVMIGFLNKIKNTFGYIFNFITFGFNTIIELVHGFLNSDLLLSKIVKAVTEIFNLFADIAKGKDIEDRLQNLRKALDDVWKAFQVFIENFKEHTKDITIGKMLLIAFAVGAVMLMFSLQRLTEAMVTFTNTARNTINIGATINRAFNSFANYSPAAQTLITFAIAIAAVSSALMTLSTIEDTEKLKTAGKILAAFAIGLLTTAVTLTLAYKYFMYTGKGGNVAHLAYLLIGIAASLMLLVFALKAMANISTQVSDILKVSASIVVIMIGLAGSVGIMAKLAPEFQASMFSILAFAAGTLILVKALEMLKSFDIKAIWKQAILLGGLMVALGVSIGLASRAAKQSNIFTNNKQGTVSEYKRGSVGGSLLMFALSMKIILSVFKDIVAMPINQMNSGIKKIRELLMGGFVPLFLSLALINKLSGSSGEFIADVTKMLSSMALSMIVIFASVALFSKLTDDEINRGVGAMTTLMSAIGKMMAWIMLMPTIMLAINGLFQSKSAKKISTPTHDIFGNLKGVLLALGGVLLAVSILCVIVKDVTPAGMANVTSLIVMVGLLVAAVEGMATFTKGAKASAMLASIGMIVAIVGALAFLATTVVMGGADLEQLMGISLALAAIFAGLGIMFAGLSKLNKDSSKANTNKKDGSGAIPAMFGVIAVMAGLVLLFKYGKELQTDQIISILVGVVAVLGVMALLVKSIKGVRVQEYARLSEAMKVIYPAMALYATLVGSFIALSLVLNKVSDDAWGKAIATMGFISLFILGMGFVLDKAGENAGVLGDTKGVILTMLASAGIISLLALVIAAVAAVPTSEGYGAKLIALGVIVAALGVFLDRVDFGSKKAKSLKKMQQFAKSFAIMCAGVIAIAAAIAIVSSADFSDGSNIGWKLAALAAGIALVVGLFILLTRKSKDFKELQLLAIAGAIVAMSASLVIIGEAIKNIASLTISQVDTAARVLMKFMIIFGVLALLVGAISGIPGFGEGFSLGLFALSVSMVAFGATLLLLAASVKIFADAVHELSTMSTEDIDRVVNNINRFIEQIPTINEKLREFGPELAASVALWIQYVAVGIGMAAGSLVQAAFTLMISIVAGAALALPVILDVIAVVIEAIADWIIENQDVIVNATRAVFTAILAAGEGMIDAFFVYFGVKLADFKEAVEYMNKSRENNERIKNETGNVRAQSVYKYYEDEKKLLEAGISEFETIDDLNNRVQYIIRNMYLDSLLAKEDVETLVKEIGDIKVEMDELDSAREYRQWHITGMDKNDIRSAWFGLPTNIEEGLGPEESLDIYFPLRSDKTVAELIANAHAVGKDVGEAYADGLEEAGKEVNEVAKDIGTTVTQELKESSNVEPISNSPLDLLNPLFGFKRSGGASMANNAANSIVKAIPNRLVGNKLKEDVKPEAVDLGEDVANTAGEAAVAETQRSADNYVEKIVNAVQPYLKEAGIDLGTAFSGGILTGMTPIGLVDIITGKSSSDEKTVDQWRSYYNELITDMELLEKSGISNRSSAPRWMVEGFSDVEEAVRANAKVGENWFNRISNFVDNVGEVKEMVTDYMPNMDELAGGLKDAGDEADEAAKRIENLKNTVAGTLDIFTEFNKETELTGRQVLKTFMGQLDGVAEWTEMVAGLTAKGVSQPIISMLEEAGPSSYERVQAIYKMSTKEIALLNAMYHDSVIMANKSIDVIEKTVTQGLKAGGDKIALWPETIAEFDEKFQESGEVIGEEMVEGIVESDAMAEAGSEVVELLTEGIIEEVPEFRDAFKYLGGAAIEALRRELAFEEALEDVTKFRDELSKSIKSSMNIFDEVAEEEEISAHKMLHNMTQQVKKVGRWATNLSVLASRGMSEGLLNQLKDLGPAGAAKVEAFVKMSAAQLQRANNVFASSEKVGNYAADKLVSSYANAGYQTSLGFSEGIDPEVAEKAMYELGAKSLTSLQESLDIHSPSRKTYEIGVNTILGFKEGMEDPAATDELMATIADFGLKVKEAYKESTDEKYLDHPDALGDNAYEPVIRPLVDMSGVESGISSFFANKQFNLSGTIGAAMAAQNKGPSQDAILITNAVRELGSRVDRLNNSVNELRQGQAETRNAIRGIDIRLDTGALVGGIVNQVDSALGSKAVKVKRRKG